MLQDFAPPARFTPSPRYWLLAAAGMGAGLLFAWELRRGWAWEPALLAALTLGTALWALRQATTAVSVETAANGQAVIVRRLGSGAHRVESRQIFDVGEAGRMVRIVSLLYHPLLPGGRLDVDSVRTLALPALRDQHVFLAAVQPGAPAPTNLP